ncbi:uncharacterized protein CcaverHIS019_0109400 [Cutaneotrichosporon cavernicola]|uniref:HSF-type DNA-binding domain-containing protein n=1 Tax=Cutaneotrichosporon cavernicola TaxID=279322 RepID=A0AA48L105_9TREE|nr:uncharacterized protein CcaverHIS019_0109400 [Cutaneotrichosporon cavernicola]BEI88222.1 hypothetical protein CcaverHIS019_0109400 [Cutaneotrichosporon cavernicola]
MDAFPANSLEHPFLGPDHDLATRGHRGSSPHRISHELDLHIPDFGTLSGAGSAPDQPSFDTSGDRSQSFGDAHAADTLVNLANWSSPTHFANYDALQSTICPEAVRPYTAGEPDYSVFNTPPSYASISDHSSSSSFAMPTPTHFDVPIHPDVFEAEPRYDLTQPKDDLNGQYDNWPLPSSEVPARSDLPPSSVPRPCGSSWPIDPDFSGPPSRRAPSPSFSTASSATWTDMPKSPSTRHFSSQLVPAPLKFRSTHAVSEDLISPALSMPTRDTKNHVQGYGNVESSGIDSPSQVYQQLTGSLEEPEPTDVDTDDDGEYVDNLDNDEYKRPVQVRGRQKQNHRKTFKVGLWDTINDISFRQWIHWSEDGKCGEIPDKSKFQGSKAMRAITDAKDFGGFVRQLHMSCGFRHDNFRRGRFDLLEQMKRKGETKVLRQVTKPKPKPKLKPSARAKKHKVAGAAKSSAIKPRPKATPTHQGVPGVRRSKGPVKNVSDSESEGYDPTNDLEAIFNAPATKPCYTAAVGPSRMIHKQSAERDSQVLAAPKRSRASKQTAPDSKGPLTTPAPQQAVGPSTKAILKGSVKRRAPTPDPISSPTKHAKVARSRSKGMRM